jgi:hypothetical protein
VEKNLAGVGSMTTAERDAHLERRDAMRKIPCAEAVETADYVNVLSLPILEKIDAEQ